MTIQEAIKEIIAGKNLTVSQARDAFDAIMSGSATDAQIGSFITALRMKGETPDEITGAAAAMREKAARVVPADDRHVVDTCGTGGDGAHTFNISTAAAFVAAGAGALVAKHGNRSVSSKCGSADVLEALGVNIGADAAIMKQCLDEIGICFLFAPSFHKAMKFAIGPRKEIGIRTIFNIIGPLTNPSLARAQLLGVFSPQLTDVMATALLNLGSARAYVVHGGDGLDEITVTAETRVAELSNGNVTSYDIRPEDFGINRAALADIAGGTARENAAIVKDVLNGKKGPRRDIVVLNAGFAVAASGLAADPKQGIAMAQEAIDKGKAMEKLQKLAAKTGGK
ncbi:MAG TPA: anthranilate phosphoribosyltransferase [Chitinivibrionales bacterium]|nr:anthranilate phosphoribosyltransferase [Chitinivibrionales bacterium]